MIHGWSACSKLAAQIPLALELMPWYMRRARPCTEPSWSRLRSRNVLRSRSGYLDPISETRKNSRFVSSRRSVVDITGSASKIVHRPLPTDDPKQRQPDISEAQELVGWRPTVPLRVGLTKTAAYFEELLAREAAIAVAVWSATEPVLFWFQKRAQQQLAISVGHSCYCCTKIPHTAVLCKSNSCVV